MSFERVAEANETDKQWIETALRANPTNSQVKIEDIIELIGKDKAQLWRYEGPGEGIMVTQVFLFDKELFVWLLAGSDMNLQSKEMLEVLETFSNQLGLKTIRGSATPYLAKYMKDVCGFKIESVTVVKEL